MKQKILQILRKEKPLIDIWHYFLGNYRYFFYYGGKLSKKYGWVAKIRKNFIRRHIKDQITWRIIHMDRECYRNGSCKLCGCLTTALQMADKSCNKPCYPPMMNKSNWIQFNYFIRMTFDNGKTKWRMNPITKKPEFYKPNDQTGSYEQVNS